MTEQHEGEHEWVPRVLDWEDVDGARCSIPFCDAQMDDKEMSRRLNEWETLKRATERLDLKHAKQMCAHVAGPTVAGKLTDMYKAIRDYIDILEGK